MDCGIPFCHNGCPLGNLIPEWNDFAYREDWSARLRAAARHEQLPGVHRPAVPGARASRRACSASTSPPSPSRTSRSRSSTRRGTTADVAPAAARAAVRQDGRGHRLGPGGPGRRPAAHPGRPHRRRVRARRPHRRPAALRHPRVQDGEAAHQPPHRADARGGHQVPHRHRDRPRPHGDRAAQAATTPSSSPPARRPPATCRSRAGSSNGIHQAMEYLPLANKVQEGDFVAPPITAEGKHVVVIGGGDTGADCVGTAHRQGAASVTQLEIMPRPGEERHRGPAVADLPDALQGHLGARGGRRAGLLRLHHPLRGRRGRQRPVRCTSSRSSSTTASCRRSRAPSARSRPAGHPRDGLHRHRTGRTAWSSSSAWSSTSAATSRATPTSRPTSPACSSPVTRAAASRSSCGRSRRAARRPAASTAS